jgi:hypothetical protein
VKDDLKKHLKRKYTCEPIVSNISVEYLLKTNFREIVKAHKCNFCDKTFAFPQGKYKHQKTCANKDQVIQPSPVINNIRLP